MSHADEDGGSSDAVRRSTLSVVLIAGLGTAAFASIPLIVIALKRRDSLYGDILFPLVLIAGLVALLAAISLLVFLLRSLGLEDRRFALGMPDGSIRAIIAVMLILLFA